MRKRWMHNYLYRIVFLVIGFLTVSGITVCLADSVDLSKEKSFGVSNHSRMLTKTIPVFDGFLFHRYENQFTKKIDNSEAITFTYIAEYKMIDLAKMKANVVSSKKYSGSISAGKNETFLDLKTLMKDLGVKKYEGMIGVKIIDAKGANCVGVGNAIDLRFVKTALDAARQ